MLVVTKYGDSFKIDDGDVPENTRCWSYNKTYMFPDDTKLETCWVASVCKKEWDSDGYSCVGERVYDHKPTKEELLWLMGNLGAVQSSYIVVDQALRISEEGYG